MSIDVVIQAIVDIAINVEMNRVLACMQEMLQDANNSQDSLGPIESPRSLKSLEMTSKASNDLPR